MTISGKEKKFFKGNKEVLKTLLRKRINDLQNEAFSMSAGKDRDIKIEFIREFKDWLVTARIFGKRESRADGNDKMI